MNFFKGVSLMCGYKGQEIEAAVAEAVATERREREEPCLNTSGLGKFRPLQPVRVDTADGAGGWFVYLDDMPDDQSMAIEVVPNLSAGEVTPQQEFPRRSSENSLWLLAEDVGRMLEDEDIEYKIQQNLHRTQYASAYVFSRGEESRQRVRKRVVSTDGLLRLIYTLDVNTNKGLMLQNYFSKRFFQPYFPSISSPDSESDNSDAELPTGPVCCSAPTMIPDGHRHGTGHRGSKRGLL